MAIERLPSLLLRRLSHAIQIDVIIGPLKLIAYAITQFKISNACSLSGLLEVATKNFDNGQRKRKLSATNLHIFHKEKCIADAAVVAGNIK